MKKNVICLVVFLSFVVFICGCESTSGSIELSEVSMKDYFAMTDFQFIVIGESTFQDVYEVFPLESMQITSYGGCCEYPMENGGYIRIKFYGQELVVGAIEEV